MERIKKRDKSEKEKLINRLNRIVGQLNGIKKMIEDERYCSEIINQLSAVDKAVKSLANNMLDTHMHTCMIANIKNDNYSDVDEIVDLFKRFQ